MEAQGKAGFEPGKRAIFTRLMNGDNLGKVVRLVCEFVQMDAAQVGDSVWDSVTGLNWIKGELCHRTWIVETLGSPIVYFQGNDATQIVTHNVGPVPEHYLTPLDDFEADEGLWEAETATNETEAPEPVTTS